MISYHDMLEEATRYLEKNNICPKHHVEHTGSNTYLLDFYSSLGKIKEGKSFITYLLGKIVSDGKGMVFYPGRLNQMNMSNNVIDTGSAVDTIARFARTHTDYFSDEEHESIKSILQFVVTTYLAEASVQKPITNQRLWGLTGLASFIAYTDAQVYIPLLHASIEHAFSEMTEDGFFRYYPNAQKYAAFGGYDDVSAFYQSRHIAFIRYALTVTGEESDQYEERLQQAERALLSMYKADGTKDLRMECKRWYWQSPYEVASHSFDAYVLALSHTPEASSVLHNVLYQMRRHFFDGYLHSSLGPDINFQCSIFWTAHLAWFTRVLDARSRFESANSLKDFSFRLKGKEIFTDTTPSRRVLVNARWSLRNPSTGIFDTGLPDHIMWRFALPSLPPALMFSVRETLNHIWYAVRGWHLREATLRLWRFSLELVVMLLPRYSTRSGHIGEMHVYEDIVEVVVFPASKYGTVLKKSHKLRIPLPQ